MSFPILVEAQNGHFTAFLVGAPDLSVVKATREQAIAALRAEIQQRIRQGELLLLEVETVGVSDMAGIFTDDPTLRDICDEAYRLRDSAIEP